MRPPYLLTLALLLFLLLPACGEDDDAPARPNTFTAVLDGEPFEGGFNLAAIITNDTLSALAISGTRLNDQGAQQVISVQLITPADRLPVAGQTFTQTILCTPTDPVADCLGIGVITDTRDAEGTSYTSVPASGQPGRATLSFTEIDYRFDGRAVGTFSGTVVDTTGQRLTVENGAFDLRIVQ